MADWEDLDNRPAEDDDDLDDDWDVDSEEEREKKAQEEADQKAKIEAEKLRKKQLKEQEAEEKRRKAERLAELNRIKSPAEIQAEQEQAQLDIAADMFDTTEVNSAENSIKSLNIRDGVPTFESTFDSLKPETKADFLKLKAMIVRKIDEYSKHPIGRTLWSDVILELANKQDIDDHELVKAVGTKVSAVGNNKMADWKLKNKKKKKGSNKPGLNSSNAKFTIKNAEDSQCAYNDEDYDDFM